MRKYMILLGATLVGGALFAQPRILGTHAAHDGKLLTMEDAVAADRIFNLLMGDVVEPRREYIEKHAANVKDLDI